jgi:DNA primase
MQGFEPKFIEQIKYKNDIVDVIGRYVRLEQRGGNFWGVCPFHHEKTASFSVNPSGQFFYCFGCHKSGDVISFISEIESLDFADAVRFLAERAGIEVPTVKYDDEKIKEQKKKKERCLELLKETARFYVRNLNSEKGRNHYEYAINRKLKPETLVKFGFGASLDFNSLPNYLKDLGYNYEEMLLAGAVGEKNGRYFDWLGGRLIIPLIDQFGNVISFAGRRIDGGKEQKYINTRESYVFSKGKTFFNLNNLKKAKNETGIDSVILVEGHLDVVSLVQGGINNVLASMGTALTKDQARILKRYSDKVYISYDGDFAGQKASIRGLEILKEEGLDVKVVSLPDGMDPDDVIKKLGKDGYKDLLNSAMPLIDFKLDIIKKTFDVKTVDGKRKYVTNAVNVIRESSSPAEQEDLLKTVREVSGTTLEALRRELYSQPQKASEQSKQPEHQYTEEVGDKVLIAGRFILYAYLFNKPYAEETDITEIDFINVEQKKIRDFILARKQNGEKVVFSDLYDEADGDRTEISKIAALESSDNSRYDQSVYFNDCIKALRLDTINKKLEVLTKKFAEEKQTDERRRIAEEMRTLMTQKNKMI